LIIQSLDLVNFRNIEKATLVFSGTYNVIRGRNAQGKTNLLEAIHLFSLGRSFRTRRREEMVRFDEEYLFARLACRSDSGVGFRIEVGIERGGRISVSVNGKKLASLSEIIGIIPTVIFTPEDVALASGPPAERRMFVDYTASQISPSFFRDLKEYRRVLLQRNAALKRGLDTGRRPEGIGAWSEMLVESGAAVVDGRMEVLAEIEGRTSDLMRRIMPGAGSLSMRYASSFDAEAGETSEALREALARTREQEKRRGYTLVGPHYDDIRIYLDDEELRRYGSQGRKRLASIVLKLAQARAIMERRAERPVVLLDDIFSELDDETSGKVKSLLSDGYQSFITTPRTEELDDIAAARFTVTGGAVKACEQPARETPSE
jgi:DNA replication and repair protein RecF